MNPSNEKNEAPGGKGSRNHIDVKRAVIKKIASGYFAARTTDRLIWGRVKARILRFSTKKYRIALMNQPHVTSILTLTENFVGCVAPEPCARQLEYCDGHTNTHWGLVVKNGVATSPPYLDAPCFTQDRNGRIDMSRLRLKQLRLSVGEMKLKPGSVNQRKLNPVDIAFYSSEYGRHTPSASCAFSIIGQNIFDVKLNGAIDIPKRGMAVVINAPEGACDFHQFRTGQKIEYILPIIKGINSYYTAFQCQTTLISGSEYNDAVKLIDLNEKDFQISHEAPVDKRMNHFAVGITHDYDIIMACLSHNAQSSKNVLPLRVIARFMKDLGCVEAMSTFCSELECCVLGDDEKPIEERSRDNYVKTIDEKIRFPAIGILRV